MRFLTVILLAGCLTPPPDQKVCKVPQWGRCQIDADCCKGWMCTANGACVERSLKLGEKP